MKRKIIQIAIAVFVTASFFALNGGCDGGNKPDLIPERRPGGQGREGYCNFDDQHRLVVIVKNQGANTTSYDGVKITVEFLPGGVFVETIRQDLGKVWPTGGTVEVPFDIPAGGISNFKITVDSDNTLDESNEGNNIADGRCIN